MLETVDFSSKCLTSKQLAEEQLARMEAGVQQLVKAKEAKVGHTGLGGL